VIPGNEGRGYVLRRIIRRAIRHGYKLGQKTPFFHKLVAAGRADGRCLPELAEQQARITSVLKAEEERFFETWPRHGDPRRRAGAGRQAEGANAARRVAFKLHDTYGFPLDLTTTSAASAA
jgi:alanyl-tRNA synthetase